MKLIKSGLLLMVLGFGGNGFAEGSRKIQLAVEHYSANKNGIDVVRREINAEGVISALAINAKNGGVEIDLRNGQNELTHGVNLVEVLLPGSLTSDEERKIELFIVSRIAGASTALSCGYAANFKGEGRKYFIGARIATYKEVNDLPPEFLVIANTDVIKKGVYQVDDGELARFFIQRDDRILEVGAVDAQLFEKPFRDVVLKDAIPAAAKLTKIEESRSKSLGEVFDYTAVQNDMLSDLIRSRWNTKFHIPALIPPLK